MSNINSVLLSIPEAPLGGHFLGIDRTEAALVSWLQTQGSEVLPSPLLITASVLLAWVDPHDLISVLEMSLHEVARETQLQEGEGYTISHLRGNRCFMEERMYRAQMEVSLFSKAMVNLCEEMTTRCRTLERCSQGYVQYSFLAFGSKMLHPTKAVGYVEACQAPSLVNFGCFRPTEVIQAKCNAWLLASSHSQDTIQVSDGEETLLASQQIQEIPQFHERLLCPNERFLFMPRSVKSLVDNVTYCAYMSACLAEINEPPDTNACDSFKTKEYWTLDTLKSNLHILDLKKQRAEAEMDMFYEAIERSSEFGSTNNGTSSGTAATYAPANNYYADDVFDDLFSTSSTPSNDSVIS